MIDPDKHLTVWQINMNEAEEIYRKRHMNNYVHAALSVFHAQNYPSGSVVQLKKATIPDRLQTAAENFTALIPYIDGSTPSRVRQHYIYLSYQLFLCMKTLELDELDATASLLSAFAFIPVIADKNDNKKLWFHPVLRKKTPKMTELYNLLKTDISVPDYTQAALFDHETCENGDLFYLSRFTTRAVATVIGMIENGLELPAAVAAFMQIEDKMLSFEKESGVYDSANPFQRNYSSRLRYRNTLYLYGGNALERAGRLTEAYDWYTKDIDNLALVELIGFYLTGLKTTERLLCARRVDSLLNSEKDSSRGLLQDLIRLCFHSSLKKCASYARIILDYVDSNDKLDLSQERFFLEDNKFMLFGGESSREPFLISLVYNKIINGIDYSDIDYSRYFKRS